MTQRIPNTESPTEVRQAFQRLVGDTDVITAGGVGEVLIGAGTGVVPTWSTILTTLTLLTVDNITIDGATITSDSGTVGFGNENLTTTGTIAGVNVTSGADPGHTHTGASLTIDHGADLAGLGDDDHALYHTDARGDARYYTETELDAGQLDTRYFTEAEHLNTSAGAADAGKPIKLDAAGHVDATMINDGDIDHNALSNYVATKHFDTTSLTAGSVVISNGTTFVEDNVGLFFNTASNRLGIGSSSPQKSLHISHTTPAIRLSDSNASTDQEVSGVIEFYRGDTTNRVGYVSMDSYTNDILALATDYTDGEIRLRTGNAVDRLIIDKDGNVSILGNATFNGTGHNSFTDFVGNEHVDHTGVSIATAATSGISGGGTIASTRNLVLNIDGLTGESGIVATDTLAFYDDGVGNRKVTLAELSTALGNADEKVKVDAAATAGYLGVAAGDGVLRVNGALSYVDGGDFVTLGGSGSKAKAYATSDQDITTGTPTKVTLDTEDFDPGGDFANDAYTAPATGYYFVCGKVRTNEILDAGKIVSVYVYVNGAQQTAHRVPSDGIQTTIAVISDVVYAESGQDIELWVYHNQGSNIELYGTAKRTALIVHRLS